MTAETLTPVAVPVEPTTPIKPSEALRLGRLTHPNRPTGMLYVGPHGQACALGAIAIGLGYDGPDDPQSHDPYAGYQASPAALFAQTRIGEAFADEIEVRYEGWSGDRHRWTDDEIVAWLEGQGK